MPRYQGRRRDRGDLKALADECSREAPQIFENYVPDPGAGFAS
jgi:hypothetical protein